MSSFSLTLSLTHLLSIRRSRLRAYPSIYVWLNMGGGECVILCMLVKMFESLSARMPVSLLFLKVIILYISLKIV